MSNNNTSSYFPPCVTTAGRTPLFMAAGGTLQNWSEIPATSNVNINNYDIANVNILDSTEILTGTITSLNSINGNLTVQNLTSESGNIKILNEDDQAPNYLQAISGNLYFNTELLAKANDIQNVADWSLYPALSNVNIDNKGIKNAGNIAFGNNINVLSIDGSNQLLYNGNIISSTPVAGVTALNTLNGNLTLLSTNPATLTVDTYSANGTITLTVPATSAGVSTLNTLSGAVNITSTNVATLTVAQVGQDVQLTVPPSAVPAPTDWANYPAIAAVSIPDKNLNMTTTTPGLAYNKATLNADVDIGALANAPLRPDFNAYCGTVTFGGITSPLTAMNINSIGSVNINSILGISLAGGGGVSIAGAGGISVVGTGIVSVAGGGISINGAGGVSIVGTGVLSIASGGILVSGGGVAVTAGGMTISAGGLGVLGGTLAIGALSGAGGGVNVFGSDIQMIPVGPATSSLKTNLISGYTVGGLAITDVATINGAAYPPPSSSSVISERATNTTPINITAVTFGTAQTILTMTITPTTISDINVSVSFHYQTNSNTNYNLIFYLTLDGVQIGTTTVDTLGGATHFSNCAIVGSGINQSIGPHTILLKAYAGSAPAAGNLTIIASSGIAIANLV